MNATYRPRPSGEEELLKLIGEPPEGSRPDEWFPRDATWHKERLNWAAEVRQLRAYNDHLREQLADYEGGTHSKPATEPELFQAVPLMDGGRTNA
jgi:hypothetical protein